MPWLSVEATKLCGLLTKQLLDPVHFATFGECPAGEQ